ncbi:MAG: LysR family transcriptional regulator [Burkholderiaceae bacterium]
MTASRKASANDALSAADFDWALIRPFLAVLDAGSLLGAARRLGSAQPTVGRQIEALERQLGMALFERTGRGVVPTAAAHRIAADARRIEAGAQRLAMSVGSARERASLVRISASRVVALHLLPPMLARLQASEPAIDVAVVSSDELANLLRRDADIAIRQVRPTQASLVARRVGQFDIVPCARRDYLDRFGTPRSLADLARHRLIGPDRDQTVLAQFLGLAQAAGIADGEIPIVIRSDDFPVQLAAIRAGLGIGFAAAPVVRQDPALAVLSLPMPVIRFPIWLAVHREIRGDAGIRRVFDHLASELAAL